MPSYAGLRELRERMFRFRPGTVAHLARIEEARLEQIEAGDAPSVFELEALAEVYGLDSDVLWDEPIVVPSEDVAAALASQDEFHDLGDMTRARLVRAARAAKDLVSLRRLLDLAPAPLPSLAPVDRREQQYPSWRYADPRAGLLDGSEWEATRPIICRTLGLSSSPDPTLTALAAELDRTYCAVAARLPDNPAVRFDKTGDKHDLVLSPLDKMEEPASLLALRETVAGMLPRVDLPVLILEVAARTRFTDAFTHISERTARATYLHVSLCAVLMAEACNTGLEPLIRGDVPALKRDRLSWVDQNYLRDDTQVDANALLVAAQSHLALASLWGCGEVASADGMRFVVPVRTVQNPGSPIRTW